MYQDILRHIMKEMRVQKRLKQSEVATELKVSQGTYNNRETGKRTPRLEIILQIADLYDVELDYLFGRDVQVSKRIKHGY